LLAVKFESLARGEAMTLIPMCNLDNVFFSMVCVMCFLSATSAGCIGLTLVTVLPDHLSS
jgi:hypothetical protein